MPPGQTLPLFVNSRRRRGIGLRRVAEDIYETTNVRVSHATLRNWFPAQPSRKAS